MRPPKNPKRRVAFTMVELLVVIVILSILLGLLVPAVMQAVATGRDAAVSAEINAMAQALAAFKSDFGDYPPSQILLVESGDYSSATIPASLQPLRDRSVAFLRKFWPRMSLNTSSSAGGSSYFSVAAGQWYDFNGDNASQGSAYYVLQGHECLVLFLGGVPQKTTTSSGVGWGVTGFGKTPANPFTSSTPPSATPWPYSPNRRAPYYEFKPGQLVTSNNATAVVPAYVDSLGAGQSTDLPGFYVYFSAYSGAGYDPSDVNFSKETDDLGNTIYGAFMTSNDVQGEAGNVASRPDFVKSAAPNPYVADQPVPVSGAGSADATINRPRSYYNGQTFQIISPGRDRQYGIGGQYDPKGGTVLPFYPTATNDVTKETPALDASIRDRERDNLTNFSTGGKLQ